VERYAPAGDRAPPADPGLASGRPKVRGATWSASRQFIVERFRLASWWDVRDVTAVAAGPYSEWPIAARISALASSAPWKSQDEGPLARRRPSRCNASMILRRLIAWVRFRRPQPLQRRTVLEVARDRTAEFDLAEFGRLLSSGKREDLKKIAQVMSQPDRARLRSGR
jgi:hypothetical protein